MSQRCLLIIDMLNDFLDMWPEAEAARLVANTNRLAAAFRERGLPVIWVRQEFRADLSDAFLEMRDKSIAKTIENTRGAALHPELDWQAGDRVVVKKRYSAFFGTNLDTLLESLGAQELVLCGVNTHACIRMAAIDAYQRDYRVTLAKECIDSLDTEHARVSLAYMDGKIARVSDIASIIETMG